MVKKRSFWDVFLFAEIPPLAEEAIGKLFR
jgi:hypothetical protein